MQQYNNNYKINLDLGNMVATRNLEEQCSKITLWLKQFYPLNGIGFFLKEPETTRTHFFSETISMDMVQKLQEMILKTDDTIKDEEDTVFFKREDGKFTSFKLHEDPGSMEPIGISIPLGALNRSVGSLILLTDSGTIQNFKTEPSIKSTFLPLVTNLLDNALSHELKDKKIRMLNLYQNVSSSLAYISDLQELLSTITGIVTSELLCEECSVLFYDEDTNEFEFFTAYGETGMNLVMERFPADKGIAGRALKECKTQIVNDVRNDPDFYSDIDEEHDFQTKSILSAPLIAGEEPVGVINAVNKIETKFFSKEDDQILSAIADEVAFAVKNARLFDYIVDSYCKIRQGLNTCRDCKRPLKSWTPCARHLGLC